MGDDPAIAIEAMRRGDWDEVAAICAEGIRTGHATFETEVPSWEVFDERHLHDQRLVARDGEEVLGWAALSRASVREVYQGGAECSVYVGEAARGRGVGAARAPGQAERGVARRAAAGAARAGGLTAGVSAIDSGG